MNGWETELRTNLGTLTPVAAQILTIDFGDTVVEAATGAYVRRLLLTLIIASACSPDLGNGPDPERYKGYV